MSVCGRVSSRLARTRTQPLQIPFAVVLPNDLVEHIVESFQQRVGRYARTFQRGLSAIVVGQIPVIR